MPVKNKSRLTNSGFKGVITSLNEEEKEVLLKEGIASSDKVPTNVVIKDNKIGLGRDSVWLTDKDAINLGANLEYDATTKTLNAKGGGESVSPTLNLLDFKNDTIRTTITEQEKINLEKGLYNQVIYRDLSSGSPFDFEVHTPSKIFYDNGEVLFTNFDTANIVGDTASFSSITLYVLEIGEKNTSGEYPITIYKTYSFNLGSGGGESVSPTLSLVDFNTFSVRTTITEQEKINLEKGLYNQVIYFPNKDISMYLSSTPSKLLFFQGGYKFVMPGSVNLANNEFYIPNFSTFNLEIGSKNASGEYPITVSKINDLTYNLGTAIFQPIDLVSSSVENGKYILDLNDFENEMFIEGINSKAPIIAWFKIDENITIPIVLGTTTTTTETQYNGIGSYIYFDNNSTSTVNSYYKWTLKDVNISTGAVHRLSVEKINYDLGKSINLFGNHSILVPNASTDTAINLYNHFIKITGTKDTSNVVVRLTVQSSKNTNVTQLNDLKTLLGDTFEIAAVGYSGSDTIVAINETGFIQVNAGVESTILYTALGDSLTFTDTIKTV